MKPRIFIGSSSEGIKVAERVKAFFDDDFECFLWNDGIFKHNHGILETLLTSASLFDFGLMVVTKDDLSDVRGKLEFTPRDNVLFEYGLFLGRVGLDRAYMICEKGVKIPTDLKGINLAFFNTRKSTSKDRTPHATNSLEKELQKLKVTMEEKCKLGYLGLMPSTVIAISYFDNFVKMVSESISNRNGFDISGKHYTSGRFKIVIPSTLDGDIKGHANVYFSNLNCRSENLPTSHRPYPIFITMEDSGDGDYLEIADMPTILNGIDKAIDMYFKRGFIGKTSEQRMTEDRELRNFVNVLKLLINGDPYAKNVVTIVNEKNEIL
ncbi:MAG: nucleotide-binding protein [Muribaculaceae bacterium]|nr:nucleotide-binding protein [Muribaculaceae bacterium]